MFCFRYLRKSHLYLHRSGSPFIEASMSHRHLFYRNPERTKIRFRVFFPPLPEMHSCEIDEEEEESDYRAAVLIQTNMEDHTYNLPSEERETLSKKRKRDKAKRNRDRMRRKKQGQHRRCLSQMEVPEG